MSTSVCRLPFAFNTALLQTDLARVMPEHWLAHFNERIYDGDWSGIALRAVPGSPVPMFSDPQAKVWEDTPLLRSSNYFQEVLKTFECTLLSVRLLRLGAGAVIKEHRDYMQGENYTCVRIHVVVSTNPDVECCIDGISGHWAEGECWYGDFEKPHSFVNRGKTDRVHMVLDCALNDWLKNLIQA